MAQIAPFAALRPTPDTVGRVAAVPYDVVDSAEAAALAEGEPLSFLRVSRPEIECPPGTPIYSDAVYAAGGQQFRSAAAHRAAGRRIGAEATTSTASTWAGTCRPAWPPASRWTSTPTT